MKKIRCISIALVEHQSKILVSKAFEPKKNEYFHRPIGGEIIFGETAITTLRREFIEKLNVNLFNIQQLGVIENLFEYMRKPMHELVFLFRADIIENEFYQKKELKVLNDENIELKWISKKDFKSGKEVIYPSGILDYI